MGCHSEPFGPCHSEPFGPEQTSKASPSTALRTGSAKGKNLDPLLRIDSAKNLSLGRTRPFAEFTLSEANVLRVTSHGKLAPR